MIFLNTQYKNKQNNKGFTLIELLLVIALMAISVGITSDILVNLIRSYNKSEVLNELEQTSNFVSQKLIKELRNASDVIQPSAGTDSTSITFKINDDIYRYEVVDNILYREINGNGANESDEALTSNQSPFGVLVTCTDGLNCFRLINDGPDVVKINLKFSPAAGSQVNYKGEIVIEDTIVTRASY